MSGSWAIAVEQAHCGFDLGHDVPKGEPVWIRGQIVRCQAHAPAHAQLTDSEVDALRHAQEALAAAAAAQAPKNLRTAVPERGFANFATTVAPDRMQRGLTRRGIRMPAPKSPKPFAQVSGVPDPKSDAFNR